MEADVFAKITHNALIYAIIGNIKQNYVVGNRLISIILFRL